MSISAIEKYLLHYAEAEAQAVDCVVARYDYVLVIPICAEELDCLARIFSHTDKQLSVLLILVVNSAANQSNGEYQGQNCEFIARLLAQARRQQYVSTGCRLLHFADFFDVVLVDRNSDGRQIDKDLGVGLARKIGCDMGLKLYQQGKVRFPWIFSTDADVILPENYFSQVMALDAEYSAIVLDFEHISDDLHLRELQHYYDVKLRYYHAGITYAGSPYDYIPLGSTLIVHMLCYAQVRGFPKKNAGEDFYLLNKLAKIKPILYNPDGVKVTIQSRLSQRVPFGTGPALIRIQGLKSPDEYLYYHPQCFVLLKQWLAFLQAMWVDDRLSIVEPQSLPLQTLYAHLHCQTVLSKSQAQITSKQRWLQFIQQWFDAFKTLKAVHFFDKNLARLPLQQLLNSADFAKVRSPQLHQFLNHYDKN